MFVSDPPTSANKDPSKQAVRHKLYLPHTTILQQTTF